MKDDLPKAPEGGDPLDALLREADGYIADDGFTARVLTALPARRRHSWRRFAVLSTAMLVGAVLVLWQLPAAIAGFSALPAQWSALPSAALFAVVAMLTALASVGWVAFTVANEEK